MPDILGWENIVAVSEEHKLVCSKSTRNTEHFGIMNDCHKLSLNSQMFSSIPPYFQLCKFSSRIFLILKPNALTEQIISNYWMRLSRIWRILLVEESVIHRCRRPRWITPSEICRILHILRQPNSIIALLFIQNTSFA